MGKPTLLLQWVIVMAVSQLHAVPVRERGGIIYGTEFLKILDPRIHLPSTENEAERQPSSSSLLREPTPRPLAKPESSTGSTTRTTPSSSSLIRLTTLPTARQKSRALNTLPPVSSSNDLKRTLEFGTKTTISDTSTMQRTKSQLSTVTTIKSKSTTDISSIASPSQDKNDTESFIDYDYYYYYMDDFQLPSLSDFRNSTVVKDSETQVSLSSATSQNDESSLNNIKVAITPVTLVQLTTTKPQKARQTTPKTPETSTNIPSKPSTIRTSRTTKSPTTARPTRSRSTVRSTTVQSDSSPPASRPPFRYQTEITSESPTTASSAVVDKPSTQKNTFELVTTETPTVIARNTEENRSRNMQVTTETTTKDSMPSDTQKSRASLKDVAETRTPSQTSENPPTENTSTPTTPSTSTLPEPLTPKLNVRQQRPSLQRNSTSRNFRYTTPLPKSGVTSGDELNIKEETLQKSLGSATSSSIVVEVRVESPQREARRMPSRKPDNSQTLRRNIQKGTPSPSKTLHTVDPEYHTTSFLLSDSLVVDLSSGPKTSDKHPEVSPQSPENSTTTEKPKSISSVPLEQENNEQNTSSAVSSRNVTSTISSGDATSAILRRRGSSRAIDARAEASQLHGTVTEFSHSSHKTNTDATVTRTTNQTESTTSNGESTTKPTQTQRHSVSTSVLRKVSHTEAKVSSVNGEKLTSTSSTTLEKPIASTTNQTSNLTSVKNQTISTNTTTTLRKGPLFPHGTAPQGLAPFGEAPGGLSPFGYAPEGLHPHGLRPTGLHPHGLAPQGGPTNISANATKPTQNATITFVDATVAEGANSSVGYVAVEHNISRFRLEEKTSDGFIIGEYGEVDHRTGDVNGVRYTADSTADPNLIYDALLKFLNL